MSNDDVQMIVRLPRDNRDRFKVHCAERKQSMADAIRDYVQAVLDVTPTKRTRK